MISLTNEEHDRLAALYRYDILDTSPEPQFDRLVTMASHFFDLPMALVSFIGKDRQWFKANHGVPFSETPRCESFCTVTIAQDDVLLIPDTTLDERFHSYPAVLAEPYIRSYAGAPLITPDGQNIGTFCVLGAEPRAFSTDDQNMLKAFAEMAMDELRLRQALLDLSQMAMTDALTSLPNRVQFRQRLVDACQRADTSGEKVVLGLLDLDRFKLINDTLGHGAGDALLSEVAHRLKASVASSDLVARLSGDEFVVLLTDVRSAPDAERVVQRLQRMFAAPFLVGEQEVFVHWSLGLSVYPDDAQELDVLLSHADTAMYRAKRAGGGHTYFQAHQDQRTLLEVERLAALHHALERDELRVYFQPVVHAENHAVVGHETLLRWARPSGLVSPLDFIPLAETSGLIVPIGRWVLWQAVEALRTRRVENVSVNVSAVEFRQPDYVAYLRELLNLGGVDPRRMWLELTESSLLEPHFASVLREVHALGVQTALDDFGTGYSSLTALATLPVQMLKIDRSFIMGIGDDTTAGQHALEVMRGIVTLANAYGLTTVAEGIETQVQADLLRQLGCSYLQGYLFGRPAPLP
ncbi:sensor domain-containing phosphodiesterase [Deinococcus ruber]|nr:EAL domain-containing protein [Deinococcus ruber]